MTTWDEITSAVGLALSGEKDDGRREPAGCWGGTSEQDHAQRCVLAHYLADLEPRLDDEVTWDERSWAAYAHVGEADLAAIGIASVRALAPSLHLNLGDGYLRQGRTADAGAQLEAGLAAQSALGDDGYGALVRRGLVGLGERIRGVEGGGWRLSGSRGDGGSSSRGRGWCVRRATFRAAARNTPGRAAECRRPRARAGSRSRG